MSKDEMGTRLKQYEVFETQRRFLPGLPVLCRIDGRGWSKFTHGMRRPYDERLSDLMIKTTKALIEETHAIIGYQQSDEISLVFNSDEANSSIFFDRKIMKMSSVLASFSASFFMYELMHSELKDYARKLPHFDARVFQLPNKTEATNVILWREQDATKNAVSMAARSLYSHKELEYKSGPEMQEMMFQKGQNFNNYPDFFKRGSFLQKRNVKRLLSSEELSRIPERNRPPPDQTFLRSTIKRIDMPKFSSVINREDVIFKAANPIVSENL